MVRATQAEREPVVRELPQSMQALTVRVIPVRPEQTLAERVLAA
jgi:hypothetical protein